VSFPRSIAAEGAITCQKDVRIAKHHILDIPNLHVAKALLSLKSKGHLREVFNWCVCPPAVCYQHSRARSCEKG
jgi:hypothetical protein